MNIPNGLIHFHEYLILEIYAHGSKILFSMIAMLFVCSILMISGCEKKLPPIKIGFAACLTGQLADLGIAGRNAVILAVEDINEKGGIDGRVVELIIRDDKNVPETALKVDRDLIDQGVEAIIGHMTSSMSMAVLPLINAKKVVMISPTTTTNKLTGQDDFFFRITSPDRIQSGIMADYAFSTLSLRNISAVYDVSNRDFTLAWLDAFKGIFQDMGGRVVMEKNFHALEEFSYMDMANQLLGVEPDGILIISGALHTAMLCQQIRKMNMDIPIISSGWAGTPELIHHGGVSVEGIALPQVFNHGSDSMDYLNFREKYLARYHMEPNFASVCSYEAASFLFASMEGWDQKRELLRDRLMARKF
ncbi:MAG: ABC transporter substrate-binding protein, partial [Desulfamplus sp.]|nr:ABC transporter substrate-binding protein [Desulfamplus sp.]